MLGIAAPMVGTLIIRCKLDGFVVVRDGTLPIVFFLLRIAAPVDGPFIIGFELMSLL